MELDEIKYLYLLLYCHSGGIIPFQFLLERKSNAIWGFRIGKKLSPERSVFKPILNWLRFFCFNRIDFWIGKSKIGTKMETVKREGLISFFRWMYQKYACRRFAKPIRKKTSRLFRK
jgi:hypothetical protein